MPALISSSVMVEETSDSTGNRPARHRPTKCGMSPRRHGRAEIAADQRAALGDKAQRRQVDSRIGPGQADGDGASARERSGRSAVSTRQRMADGFDHHRGLESGAHAPRRACTPRARPWMRARSSLSGSWSTRDDPDVVVGQRGEHRGHADPAQADDDHGRRPGCGRPALMHRPATGQHRAAEQRRDHRGTSAGTGTTERRSTTAWVAKPGDAEVVVGRAGRRATAARSPDIRVPGAVGGAAGHARRQAVGGAGGAVAAPWQKGHHHALADGAHPRPRTRPPRRCRPPRGRAASAPGAPGCRRPPTGRNDTVAAASMRTSSSASPGRRQVEVGDRQRPGFGVRPGCADLFEHGAADPHAHQPA